MIARHCIVEGRVQGVGFRYFVYRQAQRLGVVGWVRNRNNGTVEVHGQGERDAMNGFLAKLRSGPSFAYVSNLRVQDVPTEELTEFSILR
jgi:acylphosphatase